MAKRLIEHFLAKTATMEERFEKGKALREKSPRLQLGEYIPSAKRPDPVALL